MPTSLDLAPYGIRAHDIARLAADLIDAPSPNPPGDVRAALGVVSSFLDARRIPYRRIQSAVGLWDVVATVEGGRPGPRVMMSGHLDTFPFPLTAGRQPSGPNSRSWGGPGKGDRVFGRGAVDMKGGVAALLSAFASLAPHAADLHGRLSICLVCDEETFGPHGARLVKRRWPHFAADAVLSGEPSGRGAIRHAERGFAWGTAYFPGDPGHAAYASASGNPIVRAGRFVDALASWVEALPQASDPDPARRPTLNVGTIRGGEKLNLQPAFCTVEVDLRVPYGMTAAPLLPEIASRAERFGGRYTPTHAYDPSITDTGHPLVQAMAAAVREHVGLDARFTLGLGATDGRLWRAMGAPVAVYGSEPTLQGRPDEAVGVEELGEMGRVHAATALRLLSGEGLLQDTEVA